MSYIIRTTKAFDKSYKKCIKRGFPEKKFIETINILRETGSLPHKYKPHKLSSEFNFAWECHIAPDWLLIWEQNDTELTLLLLETVTHSDIF